MSRARRFDLEKLDASDLDALGALLDQIQADKALGKVPWICRDPDCDGNPHGSGMWDGPHARPTQRPPSLDEEWDTWVLLAGRGFGKTRCGAEWSWRMAKTLERGALVGPTAADARDVLVEGESGILATAPATFRPEYQPSKRRLVYPNGAMQFLYSADEPDRLRGPQHHYLWADELAAWKKFQYAWDMIQMGLRLGTHPRACVTTTPRPLPLIRQLIRDPMSVVVRGSTYDNLTNLAPSFRRAVVSKYEGTVLGRQELDAEILDDMPGAMVARAHIVNNRVAAVPDDVTLFHITVGMDPAGTGAGDETGLVVVGRGTDKRDYVLEDASGLLSPDAAAKKAFDLQEKWGAAKIVVEDNGGKDWIESVLRSVWRHEFGNTTNPPIHRVNASQGKRLRAQPVGMRYEQGRVSHVGDADRYEDLETQLTTWIPEETPNDSPDRLDALVHAVAYHTKRFDRGESSFGNPHARAAGNRQAPVTSMAARRALNVPRRAS